MDSKAIHDAMRKRLPVKYNGMRYDRIVEYISWIDDEGKHKLSVGILSGRHYFRVPADKVELAEE